MFELFILIFGIAVTIAFFVGFSIGEEYEENKQWKCIGKKHTFNTTGWSTQDIFEGRGMYYCKVCGNSFDEDKKIIPKAVEAILQTKQMAEFSDYMKNHPIFKEDWEQVKKYVNRIFNHHA